MPCFTQVRSLASSLDGKPAQLSARAEQWQPAAGPEDADGSGEGDGDGDVEAADAVLGVRAARALREKEEKLARTRSAPSPRCLTPHTSSFS